MRRRPRQFFPGIAPRRTNEMEFPILRGSMQISQLPDQPNAKFINYEEYVIPHKPRIFLFDGGRAGFGRATKQLPGSARSGSVAQGVDSLRRIARHGRQPRPDFWMYLSVRRKADLRLPRVSAGASSHFLPCARADSRGQWSRLAPTPDSGGRRRSLLSDREVLQECGSF